jgi:amidophosphoribosyltransferase
VFDGKYVTGDVDGDYLARLHEHRNDASKSARHDAGGRTGDIGLLGLHNHTL